MTQLNIPQLEADINEMLARVFPMPVEPAYRYWHHKGQKDRYFWTTETVRHNSQLRYASGVYHYLKTKKAYKLTQEQYHAKRKNAKARALALYQVSQ